MKTITVALFFVTLIGFHVTGAEEKADTPAPWPQWRGPGRTNISNETGLLKAWPEGGPPLVYELHGIGAGIAAVAVAGGRVYALGYIGDSEYLTALDEHTGQRLWAGRVSANAGEVTLMRWLGQRTPTVDDDRVYAFHNKGQMVCFETQTGKELWRKDYVKEFGTRIHYWGLCDRPLIDGDKLICTPGGTQTAMVALNKRTGEVLWQSIPLGNCEHASTVISEGGGVRQYVGFVLGKAMGIRASDGQVLWTHAPFGRTANSCTPIVWKDSVLLLGGFGAGITLLKLSPDGEGVKMVVHYQSQTSLNSFQDSALMVGPYVYCIGATGRTCVEAETGRVVWGPDISTGTSKSGMTYADGQLYVLHMDGTMGLLDATPEKPVLKSKFAFPAFGKSDSATNPVIANGRMYLRQEDRLFCYDIRKREPALNDPKEGPPKPQSIVLTAPSNAIGVAPEKEVYVPTPQDVVDKMLELANVKNTDVLYDLGSGDGRIVIAAAKQHGCKATGYELDEALVKHSLENVDKAGMKDLASIEHKDVLTLDLSSASVVSVYFSEQFLEKLKPQFEKLKPGSRIVSHQFKIPGAIADKAVEIVSPFDGVKHTIYLWTIPLKKAGN